MLPIVGLFVIIQPGLFLIALAGGMGIGGILFWVRRYYLKLRGDTLSYWVLALYILITFVIILLSYRITIGIEIIRFELIHSMSYAQ